VYYPLWVNQGFYNNMKNAGNLKTSGKKINAGKKSIKYCDFEIFQKIALKYCTKTLILK
jgi:hypothetical protein